MNVVKNSVKNGLVAAAAALIVICSAQVSLAGYVNNTNPTNTPSGPMLVGSVSANLSYSLLNGGLPVTAVTANMVKFNPTAGVNVTGAWTNKQTLLNAAGGATAQSYCTGALPGGPKVVTYGNSPSSVAAGTGGTDPDPELLAKLEAEGYQIAPNPCGAGYFIASGEESINGQNYLVVLGTATDGTVHWFRGYVWTDPINPPTSKDDVVAHGQKLYDVLVPGPFDFGDMTSTDRCKALKIQINYTGPNLYMISQGSSSSGAPLALVGCPDPSTPVNLSLCNSVLMYPTITTSGGCGAVSPVTFNPAANALPPGLSTVTATASDSANTTASCSFTVQRPFLSINGFYPPLSLVTAPGTCAAPAETANSGSRIVIKFDLLLCGSPYLSPTAPTVTVKKITNTNTCASTVVTIPPSAMQAVANTWHFNWNTVKGTDVGVFRIEINLQDGNPNPPYNYIRLQ